jgi:lipoyl(octanoyl) transferase
MMEVEWLGRVDYLEAWELQKQLVAERTERPFLPHQLLLLEHPHTYTLGSSGKLENLLVGEATLKAQGVSLYQVNRGGDITYHGPGQLVGYPILNLKQLYDGRLDLHWYVREVEEVIIQTIGRFGMVGWRYPGYTGVWVETAVGPQKIAAIGIRVSSKGITSHGFALNVNTDLSYFEQIIPCGIKEYGVTSMEVVGKRPFVLTDLLEPVIESFNEVFLSNRQS